MNVIGMRRGLIAFVAFGAAWAMACGGGGDDDATPTEDASATSGEARESVTPRATEGGSPTPTVTATVSATAAAGEPTAGAGTGTGGGPAAGPQTPAGPSAVASIALASGGVSAASPIELRDTTLVGGVETFQDPSHPSRIAYYQRYGVPGVSGANAIFAAHVNYVGYGNGPFASLARSSVGDSLTLTMADGGTRTYSVQSVRVIPLDQLDMNEVVFPALPAGMERVTLISCGGTFIPNASGVGGDYNSRVILFADRYLN